MLKKRLIISLTFNNGVLFRTKKFVPDYRYTKNFIDLWNADEIILIDVSKKEMKLNNNFKEVVKFFIANCHLPITVGGGISSLEAAKEIFNLGVEKIIINSLTFHNPDLSRDLIEIFGSSSIIQAIDFKKQTDEDYIIKVDNGKTPIDQDSKKYMEFISSLNFGEVLINSIDNDGGLMGFDLKLIKKFSSKIKIPIIVQGGGGNYEHFFDVLKLDNISGVCTQNIFHFTENSLRTAKRYLKLKNIDVRDDY